MASVPPSLLRHSASSNVASIANAPYLDCTTQTHPSLRNNGRLTEPSKFPSLPSPFSGDADEDAACLVCRGKLPSACLSSYLGELTRAPRGDGTLPKLTMLAKSRSRQALRPPSSCRPFISDRISILLWFIWPRAVCP